MDALSIVALAVGAVGLLGGILWGWGASRTASRVAVKIVTATNDTTTDLQVEARLQALEAWRAKSETDARRSESDDN